MARREAEEWFWQVGGEMHRLAEEFAGNRPRMAGARFWEPRVDVMEQGNRFLIKAEIAGVKSEDIKLFFIPERHSLIIRGVRQEEDHSVDGERMAAHQLEIFYGDFQREVNIPDVAVDSGNIRAHYKNGILLVIIPKLERMTSSITLTVEKF